VATWLYRLGRFSYRRAWLVFGAWMVALASIAGIGFTLGGSTDEEFRIPGSESQEAFGRLGSVFPVFAGASVQVVLQTQDDAPIDSPANQEAINALTTWLSEGPGVREAVSPFDEFASRAVSDEKTVAFIQVQLTEASPQVTDETLDYVISARDRPEATDFRVEFGGDVFQDTEVGLTIAEVIGVAFAGLVLIITFRSFRPAWMPLASAIIGVGIVLGAVFLAADYTVISSSAPLLAVMLGLAVGIDYSLFILSRHRNQLAEDMDSEESAGVAVGTAGNAVVFAGGTVIVALLGLYLVNIPFLSVMGTAAAGAVAIAVVAAITLLPALMGMMGKTLIPPAGSKAKQIATLSADTPSLGRRWVRAITRFPLITIIITVTGLAVLAIPAASLTLALPGGGQEPVDSTQRKAYDIISESFGPGYNGPLLLTVDITSSNALLENLDELRDELGEVAGVDYVSEGFPSPTLDTVIYQVVPTTAPDSEETKDLVATLRSLAPEWNDTYEATIQVTGITAIGIDISDRIQSALIPFGIVVVGLSIVLLMLVFRSIIVPVKAALGFILSVTGAFGVVVAVFQWGWFNDLLHVDTPGPILSFMPIILMAVLFGLAMDYEVFLVSGMREQFVHSKKAGLAIEEGYASGARVVGAAAAIMFFVFFSFVPETSNLIKPIALGLAVGIALDAFVVRMTLVPAIMALFGKSAWWFPRALERSVPEADVEGEKLREHLAESQWAEEHSGFGIIVARECVIHDGATRSTPLTFDVEAGEKVTIEADDALSRALHATLTGYLSQQSGSIHVGGSALPSDGHRVRRIVSAWSRQDEDVLAPIGTTLTLRLANSREGKKLSAGERKARVAETLSRINEIIRQLPSTPGTRRGVGEESIPGLMTRDEQVVVFAAVALIDRAPISLISGLEPLSTAEERELWWAAIDALALGKQTVLLFTTPGLPPSGRRTLSVVEDAAVGVGR
jgi:putative drug exporter of the RND superfamily